MSIISFACGTNVGLQQTLYISVESLIEYSLHFTTYARQKITQLLCILLIKSV